MNQLIDKNIIVTGGSRGFGRSMVEALTAEGAKVWAIARTVEPLDKLKQEVKGVQTFVADIADPQVAHQLLTEIHPDVLILNAGAKPPMRPIHEQSWEQFSGVWETDVKATFYFGKEALLMPMPPGGVVVIVSSGAAIGGGSQFLGGFAGAKRTQWFMAQYFQEAANTRHLGLRFVTLVPRLSDQTELGHGSVSVFAAQEGITEQAYLARFGAPLSPQMVGSSVVDLLTDDAYHNGIAFGFSDKGLIQQLN